MEQEEKYNFQINKWNECQLLQINTKKKEKERYSLGLFKYFYYSTVTYLLAFWLYTFYFVLFVGGCSGTFSI